MYVPLTTNVFNVSEFQKMAAESPNEDLQKKAVDEILKETNRAAARAEVGGSLSWTKPRHKGINKRFLNNTMLSTIIQNTSKTCPPPLCLILPAKK